MHSVITALLSILGLYLLQTLLKFRRAIRDVGYLSGPRLLLYPRSLITRVLPPIRYVTQDISWMFKSEYQDFAAAGQDAIAMVSMFPTPKTTIFLADAAAIKEVTTARSRFPKPFLLFSKVLGSNIVTAEGEEWKRYRKIAAPAFSEKNIRLVWDETVRIMLDLFDNVWGDNPEIVVDNCLEITLPIALFVIGAAGFGRRVTWASDSESIVPPGHQMTFKDALRTFAGNLILKLHLPNWAMSLTARTRRVTLAFNELEQYMVEMVAARRSAETREERRDLFSGLLEAADNDLDISEAITEPELLSNMFVFLLAGYETTAHTLCFTFALLALYPDEQERLYLEIKDIMVDQNGMPAYKHMNLCTRAMAVLYETLRMFPQIPAIGKEAAEDTCLIVDNTDGGKTTIPVPSGTPIQFHVPALHHNPKYWKDPYTFLPERFLGEWPRDAFMPFSSGARGCLGRRFFETESVAVLTMILSRYKVEVKEEPEFIGETFEQRYARVTAFNSKATTAPVRVPLVFKRR